MTVAAAGRGTSARERRRALRPGIVALAAAASAALAACVIVYGFPPVQQPTATDVVLVLGPPDAWRVDLAERLVAEQGAKALLVSSYDPDSGPPVCGDPTEFVSVPVTCFRPSPFTTAGEARELRDQMRAHGWRTATVVTFTPHIARSRYVMSQCVPSGVIVVGEARYGDGPSIPPLYWLYQFAYQTGGFAKAALFPAC